MASVRNALYAQSGGVTAVINASACGVIEAARAAKARIGHVYAARNGIVGVLQEDLVDTGAESAAAIAALRHTPAGAFGSCRYKLGGAAAEAQYARLLEVFRAHDIGYFFYNGGGDSADTCLKVAQLSAELGYPLQAIHIPKTVDNDLAHTDTCPGFGSAANRLEEAAIAPVARSPATNRLRTTIMTPPERIAALAPDPRQSLAAAVCWSGLPGSITRVTPQCDTAARQIDKPIFPDASSGVDHGLRRQVEIEARMEATSRMGSVSRGPGWQKQ